MPDGSAGAHITSTMMVGLIGIGLLLVEGGAWLLDTAIRHPKMVIMRVLRKPGGERHGERKSAPICRGLHGIAPIGRTIGLSSVPAKKAQRGRQETCTSPPTSPC